MEVPFYRRLAAKISAITVLVVMGTIAYFAVSIYWRDYLRLENRYGTMLQRTAATAAWQIDGDLHKQIQRPQDARTTAFLKIRKTLRQIQQIHKLDPAHIYTFQLKPPPAKPTSKPKGRYDVAFAVMLHHKPFVGAPYKIVKANRKIFRRVLKEKRPAHTRMYQDEHGMWISAYAPILDKRGAITGILEADIKIDQFYNRLQRELQWLLLLSLSAVLVAILFSVIFAQRLNRDLQRLCQGVDAIKLHDYQYHIDLQRKDELGFVASQFNELANVIAERIDMLKYLPKHTLEAISRRSRNDSVHQVEYIKGTVVYTDLRGYASLNEKLPPEEIVETLNAYLQRQSEIFDLYGGVIDKLIGGSILAVFQEFAHTHRAVEASVDIQRAVAELNAGDDLPFPLQLGIGVATGYLVFGEIGSELRKERILLGAEVNLATRLSNRAAAGEVIVSDQVHSQLHQQLDIERSEEFQLEDDEEPQRIHYVSKVRPFNAQTTWQS